MNLDHFAGGIKDKSKKLMISIRKIKNRKLFSERRGGVNQRATFKIATFERNSRKNGKQKEHERDDFSGPKVPPNIFPNLQRKGDRPQENQVHSARHQKFPDNDVERGPRKRGRRAPPPGLPGRRDQIHEQAFLLRPGHFGRGHLDIFTGVFSHLRRKAVAHRPRHGHHRGAGAPDDLQPNRDFLEHRVVPGEHHEQQPPNEGALQEAPDPPENRAKDAGTRPEFGGGQPQFLPKLSHLPGKLHLHFPLRRAPSQHSKLLGPVPQVVRAQLKGTADLLPGGSPELHLPLVPLRIRSHTRGLSGQPDLRHFPQFALRQLDQAQLQLQKSHFEHSVQSHVQLA